jgi:hypothetical protein
MFGVLAGLCVVARNPRGLPDLVRVAALPVGIALAISLALLAYPVWMLLAGPQHAKGPTYALTNAYRNDLFSFFVPGLLQDTSLGFPEHVTRRLAGYSTSSETGGYIGIPLLLLSGFLAWRSRRSSRMQLSLFLAVVAAVLTLGPWLMVNGEVTTFELPFWAIGHLPLVDNILPARFNLVVAAFLAAVVAFGLDDFRKAAAEERVGDGAGSRARRRRWSALLAAVVLVTLAVTHLPKWPYPSTEAAALPESIVRAIPRGSPVTMTYPYSTAQVVSPMVWQAMNDFPFRMFGGYVYVRDAEGRGTILQPRMEPEDFQQFLTAQMGADYLGPKIPLSPSLVQSAKRWARKYDMRAIILDRSTSGSGPVIKLFTQAFGPPTVDADGFMLWADRDQDLAAAADATE